MKGLRKFPGQKDLELPNIHRRPRH
jgi:hypothetical protein